MPSSGSSRNATASSAGSASVTGTRDRDRLRPGSRVRTPSRVRTGSRDRTGLRRGPAVRPDRTRSRAAPPPALSALLALPEPGPCGAPPVAAAPGAFAGPPAEGAREAVCPRSWRGVRSSRMRATVLRLLEARVAQECLRPA
ncbi:hypothetical protein GCM10018793_01470 [Streptomyces sulfonofaciens]|uniref:Uncharacterized protein n=1 Tax=Streptomyces sulfonofaciens TaxID=68272 RepID=A0A919FPH9_9ACTN|nr:hypothetical protein GCM10018793_01470 [Streptomyces sulfonofaciens]